MRKGVREAQNPTTTDEAVCQATMREGALGTKEFPTDATTDNPFALTDEEIDGMVGVLWQTP
jgi:hypothetical protein